jgi:beta-N-acetylhexosaminidase
MKNVSKYLLILSFFVIIAILFFFNFKNYDDFKEQKIENNSISENQELKNKIGQMLIVGFRGTEINDESNIVKAIKKLNLGGVILFDEDNPSGKTMERNIINPEQTKKLIIDLKKYSSLFIAIDAEGGYVNRLKDKYGFKNIPSAEKMGQGTIENTKKYAVSLGETLSSLGFNLNFAPVVDVNFNSLNPVIGQMERSFSSDPEKVFSHASSFIEGLHEKNIITSIKHFPGHGSSSNDSHLGMVDVTKTYKEEELVPYKKLIENGYSDMIMTGHIINKSIDSEFPSTLSPIFLKNILREELKFKGVIVSDDMQMGAIIDHYSFNESIVMAINAGCDILIISNNGKTYNEKDYYTAVDIIFKAVKEGKINKKQIDDSYERIKDLKIKYKI